MRSPNRSDLVMVEMAPQRHTIDQTRTLGDLNSVSVSLASHLSTDRRPRIYVTPYLTAARSVSARHCCWCWCCSLTPDAIDSRHDGFAANQHLHSSISFTPVTSSAKDSVRTWAGFSWWDAWDPA